jgi:DNA-binding transcriptional ArsR family regulator
LSPGEYRGKRGRRLASHHPEVTDKPTELLVDPMRRRIIAALALRPLRPSTLAAEIGLSRRDTLRQLEVMAEAGLVRSRRSYIDRRAVLYSIEPAMQGQITAWLAGPRPTGTDNDDEGTAR